MIKSRMKKNILEFCLSSDLGGLELFMVSCYKAFSKTTNCHLIVAPNKKLDLYLNNQSTYHIKRNKLFPIFPALSLAKYIDNNDIDIIHFHWTKDINIVVLARILSKKKPKLLQTRNMTMTRFKNDFYHKWLYSHIDTIHAVTYQVKTQLEKFIPSNISPKIKMIYMGTKEPTIDKKEIINLKEKYNLNDEFIVGIVGRIEEGKGQYLIIDAMYKLKKLNIKLLIVGHTMDEKYLNSLKQKIKNYYIEDKVIFTGFTKDVDSHMQLFDVNILATKKETFGLVVIEAMINKVCVIATNSGGPLEIIEDGVDGLLFDRTSEDLIKKIKLLYNNNSLKNKMAINGYKKTNKYFNHNIQLNKLLEIINES